MTDAVPELLKTQNKQTGAFGSEPWICADQNHVYPLAVAWATEDPHNPWYHNDELLNAIILGGDKLIAEQKPNGKWIFRKKDNSTWGDIYMPWTYSRWLRAYSLIREAMPKDRRDKWEKALKLGYQGIYREEMPKRLANIPCHQAMGLYLAGKLFDRSDWRDSAAAYLHKVADAQHPAGFWSEHAGPVVIYNTVYLDALGTYHAMSGDKYVLPALERGAQFHTVVTYPDGTPVETVDERNKYEGSVLAPNVGFSFSDVGRAYIEQQLQRRAHVTKARLNADQAASFVLYAQDGPARETARSDIHVTLDHNAMTKESGPWFACMSAYHSNVSQSRWIQDRQNLVSLFHTKAGLIVGGGNTKLQPLWSTFTVGEISLLKHKAGDESPNFLPPSGLWHTPNDASLDVEQLRLLLQYNLIKCEVKLDLSDEKRAKIIYTTEGPVAADSGETDPSARGPVEAHVPLLAKAGTIWTTASGKKDRLLETPLKLTGEECGGWFESNGWRVHIPPEATVQWPVHPHSQYVKDGHAEIKEARVVITLPFSRDVLRQEISVEVP
ncbi:MAG TPA: hypothetical protein VF669_00065 [Tepidisphaeraceae bacterium]